MKLSPLNAAPVCVLAFGLGLGLGRSPFRTPPDPSEYPHSIEVMAPPAAPGEPVRHYSLRVWRVIDDGDPTETAEGDHRPGAPQWRIVLVGDRRVALHAQADE
jgi:hypothetical protein